MPITVVARMQAKEGKTEALKEALLGLVEPTRAEPGCLNYDLHQSADDSSRFLFYENWKSQDDLDKHFTTPHVQAVLARVDELLAEPPEIVSWNMISQKAG